MSLLRRFVVLGVGLHAPACADSERSQRVAAPSSGVELRYALEPGDLYEGRVRAGSSRQGHAGKPLDQSMEFRVVLEVAQHRAEGQRVLRATLDDVELDWSLPTEGEGDPTEFHRSTVNAIDGMTITFVVDQQGAVIEMPNAPAEATPTLQAVAQHAIDALEAAFVEVPSHPVRVNEAWSTTSDAAESTTRFLGLFLDREKGELVRLERSERGVVVESPGGPPGHYERTTVAELTREGALHRVDAQARHLDPDAGIALLRTRIEWGPPRSSGDDGIDEAPVQDQPATAARDEAAAGHRAQGS